MHCSRWGFSAVSEGKDCGYFFFLLGEKSATYSSCSDGGSSVAAVDGCWELHVAAWVQWVPVVVCACLCLLEL